MALEINKYEPSGLESLLGKAAENLLEATQCKGTITEYLKALSMSNEMGPRRQPVRTVVWLEPYWQVT